MNHLDYMTEGTCSRSITIDVDENGIIRDLSFFGGCNGNLKGICALAIGKKASDIKQTLKGITCGSLRAALTSWQKRWKKWATKIYSAVVRIKLKFYRQQ